MATVTFLQLKTAIVDEANLPTPTTTTNVTIARIDAMANRSLRAFYALLMECGHDGYYDTSATVTATANTLNTSFPTRFQKLRSLVWNRGTDDDVTLRPAEARDEYLVNHSAQDWAAWEPRFKLMNGAFRWLPKPLANMTLTCTYAALPVDLSADADFFEAGAGWESWVIYDVCAMIARRRGKDMNEWAAMRADVEQRIRDQAPLRGDTMSDLFCDTSGGAGSDQQLRDRLTLGDY